MEWDDSYWWTELRRLQKRVRSTVSGVIVVLFLVYVTKFLPPSISKMGAFVLLVVWIFLVTKILKAYSQYTYWLCPRCGEPFHYAIGWLGRLNNPFARRCVHCGLRKWAVDDTADSKDSPIQP